jgi:uncharacterized protein YxjI
MAFTAEPGERYTIRRKVFVFLGASFEIFDAQNSVVGFCRQKAFKLREDLRICTDESLTTELIRIKARNIIDWAATYDVMTPDGAVLGSLRRKALASMVRDTWLVFDPSGNQIATLQEDSMGLALVRRFLPMGSIFCPTKYHLVDGAGRTLARFRQHFNLIVYRLGISIDAEDAVIDDLLVLATGCLIAAIEGRQSNDSGSILDVLGP